MTSRANPPEYGGRVLLGVLLIAAGVGWFLHELDIIRFDLGVFLAVAVIFVGVGLIVGMKRSRVALIVLGTAMTLLLAASPRRVDYPGSLNTDVFSVKSRGQASPGFPTGDRTFEPSRVELLTPYHVQIGMLTIDLSDLEVTEGTHDVMADVSIGSIVVILPQDYEFSIEANVEAGEVDSPESGRQSGTRVAAEEASPGYESANARLKLILNVGFGSIGVRVA